jgi:hypothetical protein
MFFFNEAVVIEIPIAIDNILKCHLFARTKWDFQKLL